MLQTIEILHLADAAVAKRVLDEFFGERYPWIQQVATLLRLNVQQATLATVAPGIAEALVATAIGLFAAIPAVVAYNRYSAQVDTLLGRYETFTDEFSGILHRQAHGRAQAPKEAR